MDSSFHDPARESVLALHRAVAHNDIDSVHLVFAAAHKQGIDTAALANSYCVLDGEMIETRRDRAESFARTCLQRCVGASPSGLDVMETLLLEGADQAMFAKTWPSPRTSWSDALLAVKDCISPLSYAMGFEQHERFEKLAQKAVAHTDGKEILAAELKERMVTDRVHEAACFLEYYRRAGGDLTFGIVRVAFEKDARGRAASVRGHDSGDACNSLGTVDWLKIEGLKFENVVNPDTGENLLHITKDEKKAAFLVNEGVSADHVDKAGRKPGDVHENPALKAFLRGFEAKADPARVKPLSLCLRAAAIRLVAWMPFDVFEPALLRSSSPRRNDRTQAPRPPA